jgi:sugar O-acyltransferase (sialic acid O-acetyltransferase NeuD family)
MTERTIVILPQASINDERARIVSLNKSDGERVHKGDVIAVAETTKCTFDVTAEADGFLTYLIKLDDVAAVGQAVAVVSSEAGDASESIRQWLAAATNTSAGSAPAGKLYTKKAEVTATRLGIDITQVPATGERISEKDVLKYHEAQSGSGRPAAAGQGGAFPAGQTMDFADTLFPANRGRRILIIGAGNGAIQVLDALRGNARQRVVGILDDDASMESKTIMGVPVIGKVELGRARELKARGFFDEAVISVSTSISFRRRIFDAWKQDGFTFANVMHPTVFFGTNVEIGEGNVILAFCHFGACARVGNNNFLSAYASIEHHSVLHSHCSFGPGVLTSSSVEIKSGVKIGTGVFIEPYVTIGEGSVVASGCVITKEILPHKIVRLHTALSISDLPS